MNDDLISRSELRRENGRRCTMRKSCENCKSHLGAGQCRDNLELECAAGGGYEAWQPCKDAPSNERVTLTLTRDQAFVVEQACELLARLHIGQFQMIPELLLNFGIGMDEYCHRRDMANDILKIAAMEIFGRGPYNQPKVGKKNIEHERAWLVYTTLRYARSWYDHPDGGITVNYDKPMSIGEYMPKCEISKEESA